MAYSLKLSAVLPAIALSAALSAALTAHVRAAAAETAEAASSAPRAEHPAAHSSRPAADLIIRHARIWTVNPAQPQAQAVAVLNGRIVAVGSDAAVLAWRGPDTRIVDAAGKRLLPGFNDAHVHFADGGASLSAVQLNDAAGLAEFVKRLADYAAHAAKGEWIRAGDWDETKWSPAVLPTRQDIDSVTPDNPVAIDRYDGHMILVNSRALALAGITAQTPDPPGGVIVRDAAGQPTGALKDSAAELMEQVIPAPSPAQRRRFIMDALREAASHGVTSVQDMYEDYGNLAMYSQLLREGKLSVRLYAAPSIAAVEDQARLGIGRAFGSPALRSARSRCSPTARWARIPPTSSMPSSMSRTIAVCWPRTCCRWGAPASACCGPTPPACKSARTPSATPRSQPCWIFIRTWQMPEDPATVAGV